ncbi:hypothetical protein F66182_6568 [Fusarium sp. NRRL 66182]|nr:hypothetical protein F66182_6568 [Fusarium sp. NRRL 66182]
MAVLDAVPHVTVQVRVAGELATEYDPLDDQAAAASLNSRQPEIHVKHSYIESKTGAEYSIEVTVTPEFEFPNNHDAIEAHVCLDGVWMAGKFYPKSDLISMTGTLAISTACFAAERAGGEPNIRRFIFAPITRSSEKSADEARIDIKRAKSLGIIKVVLLTGVMGEKHRRLIRQKYRRQELKFAEKAMKGREISHGTQFVASHEMPVMSVTKIYDSRQLGTFIFHYRSHKALQHEMIIPRDPSPESSTPTNLDEDELSHLSEADIRRLARERLRQYQVKEEWPLIKREADWTPRPARQWKIVKLDDGKQVFDLTDD